MKNIPFITLCFLLFSCSEEPEPTPVNDPDDKEDNQSLSYEPSGEPFSKPQVQVMKVSQSEITINWYTPSNWTTSPQFPSQPEFLVETSTNPKFDNLVTVRNISDS